MKMVIKETLRLYTPVGTLNRHCIKDCILPGGYLMKKDSTCLVNLRSMHWSDEVYEDPYKYDPERWTPEEEQKRSRFSWLPFSNGVRACIGMAFGLVKLSSNSAFFYSSFNIFFQIFFSKRL
jgi:cytochrome P450/NADPH-cytochrome P450 reductase